jgi:hypothetical protein
MNPERATAREHGGVWRFVHFPASRLVIAIAVVTASFAGGQIVLGRLVSGRGMGAGTGAFLAAPILIAFTWLGYRIYVRVVERRTPAELASRGALSSFPAGALIGAGLFATTVGILWLTGNYHVVGVSPRWMLIAPLSGGLISGFVEEIVLRGIIFRILEEWLGSWIAVAISALLFGLVHLGNAHATLVGAIAIALEAGVLLAAAFMATRTLWFPIGIHFAWNFTEGGIFGLSVSGNNRAGLLISSLSGPDLLSGGTFGAEASVFAVLVCLAAGVGLFSIARRQGRIVGFRGASGPAPTSSSGKI